MRTTTNRRRAAQVAYVAGTLLLLSGTTGSALLAQVALVLLAEAVPVFATPLLVVAVLLGVLASLGGLTVILGGWVVLHRSRLLGALLISVGAGLGLVVVVLQAVAMLLEGGDVAGYLAHAFLSLSGIGLLLSVYARSLANPFRVKRMILRLRRRA